MAPDHAPTRPERTPALLGGLSGGGRLSRRCGCDASARTRGWRGAGCARPPAGSRRADRHSMLSTRGIRIGPCHQFYVSSAQHTTAFRHRAERPGLCEQPAVERRGVGLTGRPRRRDGPPAAGSRRGPQGGGAEASSRVRNRRHRHAAASRMHNWAGLGGRTVRSPRFSARGPRRPLASSVRCQPRGSPVARGRTARPPRPER